MTSSSVEADRQSRRRRLAALMARRELGALLLRQPATFAWYTGGADNRVSHADPLGAAGVLLTPTAEYILTTTIEARRMREEQTPGIEVVEYPWYEDPWPALRRVIGGAAVGADFALPGAEDVAGEVAPLRYVLDAEALARYRALGQDTRLALEEALGRCAPGMTESQAASQVVAACRTRGIATPLAMAAADDRIERYRHPVTGHRPIRRRLMVVVCAERGGLYANLTRIVDYEDPGDELRRRHEACEGILRRLRDDATRPGRTLADVFADCQRYYADAGYPDEWTRHHQGGLTGYASREVIATPNTPLVIQIGQAFAWNPSISGAKAEETFLLTADGPETIVGGVRATRP